MKFSVLTFVSASLMFGTLAQATNPVYGEFLKQKKAVVSKFLKEANDPNTEVGKKIAEINVNTEDGRNSDGTIALPIERSDLQVVMVEGEVIHVPWHYANKANGECKATGDSSKFIIYLTQRTAIHYASATSTLMFSVEATQTMSAPILEDGSDVYCEDLGTSEDTDPHFGPITFGMNVSDIKFISNP